MTALIPVKRLDKESISSRESIYWICECSCGYYYMTMSGNIKHKRVKRCPHCNTNIITDNDKVVRPSNSTSRLSDEEFINKICSNYYSSFEKYIELEDFKQEIRIIFFINRRNNKHRSYNIALNMRDLLSKVRKIYNNRTNFEVIELNENILDFNIENIFNRIEQYDILANLSKYLLVVSPRQRQILEYRYMYNYSYNKISKVLGISKQAASQSTQLALAKLKQYMYKLW